MNHPHSDSFELALGDRSNIHGSFVLGLSGIEVGLGVLRHIDYATGQRGFPELQGSCQGALGLA